MPWRGNPGRIPTKVPYTSKNPHTRLIFPEERIFRQPRVTSHTSRSGHRKNATLYHKRCPTRLATRRNYRIPTITIMEDDHYHYQDAIQQRLEVHRHPSNHRPRSLPLQHRQHIGPIHVCSAHKATPGPQQQTGPQHLDWISATISTPSPNPSQPDGRGCRKWSHHGPTTPTNKQAPQPQSSHPGHSPGHQPARPTAQCKGWRHQHTTQHATTVPHTHIAFLPARMKQSRKIGSYATWAAYLKDGNNLTGQQAQAAGAEMRIAVTQHAQKHCERFRPWFAPDILQAQETQGKKGPQTIEEWISEQEYNKTWGDGLALHCVAEKFGIALTIFKKHNDPWDRYSFAPKYSQGVAGLRQKEKPITLVLEGGHYTKPFYQQKIHALQNPGSIRQDTNSKPWSSTSLAVGNNRSAQHKATASKHTEATATLALLPTNRHQQAAAKQNPCDRLRVPRLRPLVYSVGAKENGNNHEQTHHKGKAYAPSAAKAILQLTTHRQHNTRPRNHFRKAPIPPAANRPHHRLQPQSMHTKQALPQRSLPATKPAWVRFPKRTSHQKRSGKPTPHGQLITMNGTTGPARYATKRSPSKDGTVVSITERNILKRPITLSFNKLHYQADRTTPRELTCEQSRPKNKATTTH